MSDSYERIIFSKYSSKINLKLLDYIESGIVEPYFISDAKYQNFNILHNVVPNRGIGYGYKEYTVEERFDTNFFGKLITPSMIVINKNKYVKMNKYDGLLEDSDFFKEHLNLFIKFQKKAIVDKITKINYSEAKAVEIADKLYYNYRPHIIGIHLDEHIDTYLEDVVKYEWETILDDINDLEFFNQPDYWNQKSNRVVYNSKTLSKGLIRAGLVSSFAIPMAFAYANSKLKKISHKLFESKYNNLKFIKQYLKLKSLLKVNNLNIDYYGVNYTSDECLEIANNIMKDLNNIKGSKHFYQDNYQKGSYYNPELSPQSCNEFVVFTSHMRVNDGGVDRYIHNPSRKKSQPALKYPEGYVYFGYKGARPDWRNELESAEYLETFNFDSINDTFINMMTPQPYHGVKKTKDKVYRVQVSKLFKVLGGEGEEILEDTDIAGICYSQMNYFSKTPENSWNHYIIKPITGIDGLKGYVEDSPWTPNSTHDNLINHSCLKYSIEFQQNFKNVISINNKGLVNQESGEYVFHFHDNFVSSQVVGDDLYDNYKTWNTMDEYFEDTTFHNLEPSFYENNDESDSKTGIIMNYLSYNTDFNPINWPTNNPLKIKIK